MNKRASSLLEYSIILGVVSLVLITMNLYIKRGVQGKVKDMTDYFIGREQIVEINPTATTNSRNTSVANSTVNSNVLVGGGRRITTTETANIDAASRVVDTGKNPYNPDTGGFVPAEEGSIIPPVRVDPELDGTLP